MYVHINFHWIPNVTTVVHSRISTIWELVSNVNSYTLWPRPTELQTLEGEASNLYFKFR